MPNRDDQDDNVTHIQDFRRKPRPQRHLNGASAHATPQKSKSRLGRKIGTILQFIFVAILATYFMRTCDSIFPH